ncbi:porin family protein [Hymenobacter sp. 15J16-1T3B]|uniref:outer membrane beta-barrel protein n=1 Tax=Hymenobacter sp. 15J16-1T3B TaxID=2886941 RepID=UPI001D1191D9|nr:outer membrane beta-barrel protein [Hymenobacter sp. 15J16-1T3B]MCC3155853.1 porin family protein [Hymenobacter sp. 15J16-1T3B]
MRKPLLLLAVFGLTLPAVAQTERGNKLLGVSLGDLSYSHPAQRYSSISVALHPTAGYFVADNLALGATLNLSYARQNINDSEFFRAWGYGASPFVRYYVVGQGRHQAFGEAGADLNWSANRGNFFGIQQRVTESRGYHLSLGYDYFVTPMAALEVSAGYRHQSRNDIDYLSDGLDVRVGFNVFLPVAAAK